MLPPPPSRDVGGTRVHRDSMLTVQFWHPSEPGDQQSAAD
jgi:hypothetical protein